MSDLKSDLKKIVGAVAPLLATALGGPLAGTAVRAVSEAVLGRADATEDELHEVLKSAAPDVLLKLKQADADFAMKMKGLGVELARISAEDRKDARARNAAMKDRTTPVLAWAIIGGFFAVSLGVLFGNVKVESALAGAIIGYISAKAEQVVSYYFGSSSGSAAKTSMLDRILGKEGGG